MRNDDGCMDENMFWNDVILFNMCDLTNCAFKWFIRVEYAIL